MPPTIAAKKKERDDSSLLLTLSELRDIQASRVREESELALRRAEEERVRREALEQAQRQAEEAQRLAAEAAARHTAEREAAVDREERARLAEAESRARVHAEMQLAQQRMIMELELSQAQAQAAPRSRAPLWAAAGLAILVVALAGLLFQQRESHRALVAEQARLTEQLGTLDGKLREAAAEQVKLAGDLDKASTQEEKKEIQERLDVSAEERRQVETQLQELKSRGAKLRSQAKHRDERKVAADKSPSLNCNPDDPLCGI